MPKKYLIIFLTILIPAWTIEESNAPSVAGVYDRWKYPSSEEIYEWWKPEYREKPDEQMEVIKIERIYLTGGEVAFVAEVAFPERGRNFVSGCLLIRPRLREAKQIPELGREFGKVRNPINGASCLWTEAFGSGHGTTVRQKRVLYLDGWKPVVLHERLFGNNLGDCGYATGRLCYEEEVAWTFTHLDNDSGDDLVELVIQKRSSEGKKLVWAAKVNWYLIKKGRFVPTESSTEFDLDLEKKDLF